jgi:hypothetical protein
MAKSILERISRVEREIKSLCCSVKAIAENSTPTYKVFTALVNQVGAYPDVISDTPLVIGNTYMVRYLASGDDFSNVGYVANEVPFVATGTTPTTWINGSQVIEILSSVFPTFEVIENTLGITLTVSCKDAISFFINSNLPVFIQNKTVCFPSGFLDNNEIIQSRGISRLNNSTIVLGQVTPLGNYSDYPYPIEIKVYN